MENCGNGTAECVLTAQEGGFIWEMVRLRFAGSIIRAARRRGLEDIKCEAEALECASRN